MALPFHDGTVLLSYADDLALVVTGRGNKLRGTQQALDLISGKCEELGLKISAEKSRGMMVKAADPAWQLRVQGVELSFTAHATYLRERTQARLNVMRAMTRPTAGATFSVLRQYYVQAVRSLVDYSAPVLERSRPRSALHQPTGAARGGAKHCHQDHAGGTEVVQRMRHAERDQFGAPLHQSPASHGLPRGQGVSP